MLLFCFLMFSKSVQNTKICHVTDEDDGVRESFLTRSHIIRFSWAALVA